jgi:hypothetical protein
MAAVEYPTRPPFRIDEDEITGYVGPDWVLSPGEQADVKVIPQIEASPFVVE